MEFEACVQPKIYEDGVNFKPMTYLPSEMEDAARNLVGLPLCLNHNAPQPGDDDTVLNSKILGRVVDAWVSYDKYDPINDVVVPSDEPQRVMAKMLISDDGEWGPSVIQAVEQGILKSVSLGIWHTKVMDEGGNVIDIEKKPMEVSLCKEGDIPFSDIYHATRVDPQNSMNTFESPDIELASAPSSFENAQYVYTQASSGQKIRTEMFLTVSSAAWKELVGQHKKEMSTEQNNEKQKATEPAPTIAEETTQQETGQELSPMEQRLAAIEKQLADAQAAEKKAKDELAANKVFDEHKSTFEEASRALEANQKRYDPKSKQFSVLGKRKAFFDDLTNHKTDLLDDNSREEILADADYAISTAPVESAPQSVVGAATQTQGLKSNAGSGANKGRMSDLERDNLSGQLAAQKERDNVQPAWKKRMYGEQPQGVAHSVNDLVPPRGTLEQPDDEAQPQQPEAPQYFDGSTWNLFTALAAETCQVQDKVTPDSFKQDLITVSSAEQLKALKSTPRKAIVQRYADSVYEKRGGLSKNSRGLQAGNSFYTEASVGGTNDSFAGGMVSQNELRLHQMQSDELRAHRNAQTLETWASYNQQQQFQKPADLFA